jgi:hypothetical protein
MGYLAFVQEWMGKGTYNIHIACSKENRLLIREADFLLIVYPIN